MGIKILFKRPFFYLIICILMITFMVLSVNATEVMVTYTYDDISRLTSVEYSTGTSVSYTHDMAGNITNVEFNETWGEYVDAFQTPLAGATWYYGVSQTFEWNPSLLKGSKVSIMVLHDNPTGITDTNPDKNTVVSKNWFTFAEDVSNSGSFTVDPAALHGMGNAYKIAILSDAAYWTISKGLFALTDPQPVTVRLNDTGITKWANDTANDLTSPQADFPGQDADYGRDKTNNNNSDGHAGFSYTKIGANGEILPVVAAQWSAVLDNVTGLMWENKTDDGGLHDKDNTYTWYEPDDTKNGGNAGTQNGGSCPEGNCDTYSFVQAVNAERYCGYNGWRMPARMELLSIVNRGTFNPSIDSMFFPDTRDFYLWSSSPAADDGNDAWGVSFYSGYGSRSHKGSNLDVRLVRSGQ